MKDKYENTNNITYDPIAMVDSNIVTLSLICFTSFLLYHDNFDVIEFKILKIMNDAFKDKELALHFESHIRSLENALHTLIRRGQETGDVNPWCNERALARSLLASAQGLILVSKVNQNQEALLDIAATAISTLE